MALSCEFKVHDCGCCYYVKIANGPITLLDTHGGPGHAGGIVTVINDGSKTIWGGGTSRRCPTCGEAITGGGGGPGMQTYSICANGHKS